MKSEKHTTHLTKGVREVLATCGARAAGSVMAWKRIASTVDRGRCGVHATSAGLVRGVFDRGLCVARLICLSRRIFVVDLMNFSFWTDAGSEPYTVAYNGVRYTGYWSLCAAVNRALDEGIDMCSAAVLRRLDTDTARRIFRSETPTPISFFEERIEHLQRAGATLETHFKGDFAVLVSESGHSASRLVATVAEHFPTFRDYDTDHQCKFERERRSE